MRENLIPEQRTDKNGVTSVRWVKPGTTDAGTGSALPAPALSVPSFVDYRSELSDLLHDKKQEYGDDYTKFFDKASDGILAYIHEALTAGDKPDYFSGQISGLMNDNTEDHVIEAWIHLYDTHHEAMDDMGEVDYIRGAIDSGTHPLNTYDRNNPEHAKTVKAIFQFLYEADAEQHGTRIELRGITSNGIPATSHQITNPQLADYLINNPDKVDSLIDIANDHPEWLQAGTFNSSIELPSIIREYLGTSAPLQRGVL